MNKPTVKHQKQRYQQVWKQFKDHHSTEGFELIDIKEIYLPFWLCKQNVVVEKDVELDRFSRIILESLQNGITSHGELCQLLGVDDDSFVTMQFHFLLKNDLMRALENEEYEITHQGIEFLEGRKKVKNIETVEFEYFITEKTNYLKNDLDNTFFNPQVPIDKRLSEGKKDSFSGYNVLQTHKLSNPKDAIMLDYKSRPTLNQVKQLRNDFSSFYNRTVKEQIFYDFADNDFEAHKRSIAFLVLVYQSINNKEEVKADIRRSKKSEHRFSYFELEQTLTNQSYERVLKAIKE